MISGPCSAMGRLYRTKSGDQPYKGKGCAADLRLNLFVDSKYNTPTGFRASNTFFRGASQYSTCSKTDEAMITSYRSFPRSYSSIFATSKSGSTPNCAPRALAYSTRCGLISSPLHESPLTLQRTGNHPVPIPISSIFVDGSTVLNLLIRAM